ncbi:hypothetical protein [Vibrio penaeicida]|uniref:hypothetical protein n=1 Tax=Vibrio penaeicida TaxID=104609 RepID=UPI001CC5EEAC|nr:hypothetical protein [Vibrio penaeicida]
MLVKLGSESETEAFPLPVIYEVMVFDFMMYGRIPKTVRTSEHNKALHHLQSFQLLLTGKSQTDTTDDERIRLSETPR